MRIECPSFCKQFKCIGGACQDTCCAGWEVDIDDDTYYRYQVIKGPFGDRLRQTMKTEGEDTFFPLTKEGRCPFLNDKNLCDIILQAGEPALCVTCTEYPRYFVETENYEQRDMSLSCLEVCRIYFSQETPLETISWEEDREGETHGETDARLKTILSERDGLLKKIKETGDLRGLIEDEDLKNTETAEEFSRVLYELESMNDGWESVLNDLCRLAGKETDFENEDILRKLIWYLVFRYSIDAYLEGEDHLSKRIRRLIARSIRLCLLLCRAEEERLNRPMQSSEVIDVIHRYSKQVEHSDMNVERMKRI